VPVSAARVRYAVVTRIAVLTFDGASARDRWQNGVPAAFLPGTYWLQRFASVRNVTKLAAHRLENDSRLGLSPSRRSTIHEKRA
jgi:hypothetical protein